MLYGPPGTGKSTMARVMATQCGYIPKSVNASDVRTGEDLCQIIRNALEMNELSISGENKPTCLILDEVDGALGGAEGSQSTGLKLVADFLQKCLKASQKKPKTNKVDEVMASSDSDEAVEKAAQP